MVVAGWSKWHPRHPTVAYFSSFCVLCEQDGGCSHSIVRVAPSGHGHHTNDRSMWFDDTLRVEGYIDKGPLTLTATVFHPPGREAGCSPNQ